MVEVMKIMATSFKRSYAYTASLSAPTLQQAIANPHLCLRLLDIHGHLDQSLSGSLLLSPGSWFAEGTQIMENSSRPPGGGCMRKGLVGISELSLILIIHFVPSLVSTSGCSPRHQWA